MATPNPAAREPWTERVRQRLWRLAPRDGDRLALTHARIYILPTRRGWWFILTLVLMLVTSMNYALSLGYALTFLLGGALQAAMLHTFRNLSALVIEAPQQSPPGAFAGEGVAFRVNLSNPSAWSRHGIRLWAKSAGPAAASLAPGEARPVELVLPARRRGTVALGRLTLDTDYPLGLWRAWAYVHFPLYGFVYPLPEAAPPPPPAAGQGHSSAAEGPGEEEFYGLRDYQSGDPPARVAWKAAARGRGLYVKEFSGTSGGEARIAWSATPAWLDGEARLSRLAAWVVGAEQRGSRYALELPGTSLSLGRGTEQRRQALELLAVHDLPPFDASV